MGAKLVIIQWQIFIKTGAAGQTHLIKLDNAFKKMLSFFENLTDPRAERTKLHSLRDIIGLTTCAVLSGCDDWEEIELYGHSKHTGLILHHFFHPCLYLQKITGVLKLIEDK